MSDSDCDVRSFGCKWLSFGMKSVFCLTVVVAWNIGCKSWPKKPGHNVQGHQGCKSKHNAHKPSFLTLLFRPSTPLLIPVPGGGWGWGGVTWYSISWCRSLTAIFSGSNFWCCFQTIFQLSQKKTFCACRHSKLRLFQKKNKQTNTIDVELIGKCGTSD